MGIVYQLIEYLESNKFSCIHFESTIYLTANMINDGETLKPICNLEVALEYILKLSD